MHISGGDWRPFIYGGFSSVAAEFGTFPIDTTKTRLQIQGQIIDAEHRECKYRGMIHALLRISSEEGFGALYAGIWPAVLRQATYGTIKIGVYYSLKRAIIKDPYVAMHVHQTGHDIKWNNIQILDVEEDDVIRQDETLPKNVMCGVIAGVVAASIANPTDVLKVRMQAKNQQCSKKGMIQCFAEMYHCEGARGLWRGVCPTAQRAAIVAGVELPVYDITKKNLIVSGLLDDSVTNHLISSLVAGFSGAVASTPVDVVRTRLMNQRRMKAALVNGTKVPTIYTSSIQCAFHTVQTEGFFALYKGFIPTWVRLGPWNIIFFVTYEHLKHVY